MQYLEEQGADVDIPSRDGRTAASAATTRVQPFFALLKLTSPDEALAFVKKNDCRLYFAMCVMQYWGSSALTNAPLCPWTPPRASRLRIQAHQPFTPV